ncbi:MAG: hypothetical protein HWN70_12035 [Desulfobacterales bacterium]|nr:hypothetical protein [Desulfobacterales bacterium]
MNEKASGWLSSQKGKLIERPLFLWLHYMDIHEPSVPEEKHIELVDSKVNLSVNEMMGVFKNVIMNYPAATCRVVHCRFENEGKATPFWYHFTKALTDGGELRAEISRPEVVSIFQERYENLVNLIISGGVICQVM